MLYNSENINVLAEIATKTSNKRGIRTYEFKYRGNYSSQVYKRRGEGDIYSIIGLVTDFILKEREIGFDYFWELYISG